MFLTFNILQCLTMNLPAVVVVLCLVTVSVSRSGLGPTYQKERSDSSALHIPVYVREYRPICDLSFVKDLNRDCDAFLPQADPSEEVDGENLLLSCFGMYDYLHELCGRNVQFTPSNFNTNKTSNMCPFKKSSLPTIKHSSPNLINWSVRLTNHLSNATACNTMCVKNGTVNDVCSVMFAAHNLLTKPKQLVKYETVQSTSSRSEKPTADSRHIPPDEVQIERNTTSKQAIHPTTEKTSPKALTTDSLLVKVDSVEPKVHIVSRVKAETEGAKFKMKDTETENSQAEVRPEQDSADPIEWIIWFAIAIFMPCMAVGITAYMCYYNRSARCCPQLTHSSLQSESSSMATLSSQPENNRPLMKVDKMA